MKLRDAMREKGTYKLDGHGAERPFGGLNVLFVGDFCELDGVPLRFSYMLLNLWKDIAPRHMDKLCSGANSRDLHCRALPR